MVSNLKDKEDERNMISVDSIKTVLRWLFLWSFSFIFINFYENEMS